MAKKKETKPVEVKETKEKPIEAPLRKLTKEEKLKYFFGKQLPLIEGDR